MTSRRAQREASTGASGRLPGMRYLIHEDAGGFRWRKGIPNNADDSEAQFGVTFGPGRLGSEVTILLGVNGLKQ